MGKKILIIDDDPALLTQMGDAFRKHQFDVFLASDGQAGIELFEIVRPDLVVTDIVMPAKEGVSVIIDIKKIAPDTLIIAMSGGGVRGFKNYLRWAKELGAHVAIEKPFRMSTFLMIAKQLLSEADYQKQHAPDVGQALAARDDLKSSLNYEQIHYSK